MNSRAQIAEFYNAGQSLREIERRLGVPKSTVRKALIDEGVARRNFAKNQKTKPDSAVAMRSGGAPFGYGYLEGKLVIDPHEYKAVLEILRLRKLGRSFSAIAKHLTENKASTRQGKTWRHVVVKNIFDREQLKKGDSNGAR